MWRRREGGRECGGVGGRREEGDALLFPDIDLSEREGVEETLVPDLQLGDDEEGHERECHEWRMKFTPVVLRCGGEGCELRGDMADRERGHETSNGEGEKVVLGWGGWRGRGERMGKRVREEEGGGGWRRRMEDRLSSDPSMKARPPFNSMTPLMAFMMEVSSHPMLISLCGSYPTDDAMAPLFSP